MRYGSRELVCRCQLDIERDRERERETPKGVKSVRPSRVQEVASPAPLALCAVYGGRRQVMQVGQKQLHVMPQARQSGHIASHHITPHHTHSLRERDAHSTGGLSTDRQTHTSLQT
mmetsp:Transcript_29070/g.84080  ORF Transcript_29070/g.84080 Transcript_29070/m.84080 type:complete len:116 (+) Transcript_29070:693-1040(+)